MPVVFTVLMYRASLMQLVVPPVRILRLQHDRNFLSVRIN